MEKFRGDNLVERIGGKVCLRVYVEAVFALKQRGERAMEGSGRGRGREKILRRPPAEQGAVHGARSHHPEIVT